MKKKALSLLFLACVFIASIIGVTACSSTPPPITPQKLNAPTITLTDDVATWEENLNADKFEISLDGNLSYVENTVTSKTLTNGQTLKVRAVGDGTNYTTSDWSNSVTYTESTPAPTPTKLSAPVVSLSNSGLASWSAVSNASGYIYKINGGAETSTTSTSVQLTNGQSIVVKAVGDGTNYTISDWSNSVTYTESTPAPTPTKLSAPVVTLTDDVATWEKNLNADKFEISLDGNLSYVENTVTSKTLTNGQTLKVRAVGDGTNYTTSDWSNSVTYTESTPAPTPTTAPTYLGIVASNDEPTANDVPSGLALRAYSLLDTRISLEEALRNYLEDDNNWLGDTPPTESGYEVFSSTGNTVYIQIWLDNPDQNTILSLKLNGTKHQSGGALQSFFIEDGNSYLNCVYVAVTIPSNSYNYLSYEVTEIEYVEGTNISQDGKAVLIDEDNDAVLIGLPYQQSLPTVNILNESSTATSISFDVNVTDDGNFTNLVNGWLRVVIYNQSNEILAQQKLSAGNNTVTFNNLSADTYYNVKAFILGDIHDGNGVYVHSLSTQTYKTESVITATMTSEILKNEQTGKYYPVINVEAELGDDSFTFTKVEVCDWSDEVYYTGAFNGSAAITEGILNGESYVVKVYYKNANNVEQSYRDYVSIDRLDYPWILEPCLQYGLVDDAILGFDFGDNKSNFENLTIRIIDEYSKQYLAENAIYLIDNPNAVAELQAQWENYGEDWQELYDRWYKLDQAQRKINEYYPNVEKAEWQAELAKGIYSYELVYGEYDGFFNVGNKYYVVLEDYQLKRVDDYSLKYTLSADFDLNDGSAVEENRTIIDGWFNVDSAIGENDYLFEEEFSLSEDGVVYLEVKSRNNVGGESYRELGYVNQIVLADGYDILQVLWTQDKPDTTIDEGVWLENIIAALKAGNDVHSVFPLGELEPISFDLDDIQFNADLIGNYSIRFTYIMYGKEYTVEDPYDWSGATIDYTLKGALPKVSIEFATNVEDFGRWTIASPDWVKNGIWNFNYSIEVKDDNQNLVDESTYNQYDERLPLNYSIRVRLDSYAYTDYYTQGEWSDWYTCLPISLSTPKDFTLSYEVGGAKIEWFGIDGAEKYVYTVNGGEEQETTATSISGLNNGDIVKIKAVPADGNNYCDSAYSEAYTVIDARTQLTTPTNFRIQDKMLTWNEVENATYYEIEYIRNGQPFVQESYAPEFFNLFIGSTYRIRACSENVENYKASKWSADFIYTVTLDNPTFSQIRRERVYWNSVENAEGYNYKIGENGEVVDNGRTVYLALSEIPVGEKLYVQAYATGCESTEWVMIYHNVTVLATPSVTVSGGTASWDAIENAAGYVYKINDGEEQSTTTTSVLGLVGGDKITVRATTTQNGYVDSEWSEERTQAYTIKAPVLDVSSYASNGTISWGAVDGATAYEYELDGNANTFGERSVTDIAYGQSFKVRAVCENGEYERYGEWSEVVIREDTREQLATPIIAYDPEIGLTVEVNDPSISYEIMFGKDGLRMIIDPSSSIGTQVLTDSFAFQGDDYTVYVRAITHDGSFRESEWATLTLEF